MQPLADPFFYAVAAPAVLLLGVSKTGFGAGLGTLAVPLMALAVPVPQAAAILMPLLLVMDVLALRAFRADVDRALLRFILPWGMLGLGLGALMFKLLDARWVGAMVGVFAWLFWAQRMWGKPRAAATVPRPRWGAALATASGLTSFVAHAGGPPIQAYVIPMQLPPPVFTGTMAAFFFVINLSKWPPYAALGLLDWSNLATSLVLLPLAPLGVWWGARVARRISPLWFYRLLDWGLFLTGAKLIWDGVRPG